MTYTPLPIVPILPYAGRGNTIDQLAGFDQDLAKALHRYLGRMAQTVNGIGEVADGSTQGPTSAVDGNFASFDGTTGLLLQDSGKSSASFATAAQGALAASALQPGDAIAPGDHGYGGQLVSSETDLNAYTEDGNYITPLSGLTNLPSGWTQQRYVIQVAGGPAYVQQILTSAASPGDVAIRGASVSSLSASQWMVLIESGDTVNGHWTRDYQGNQTCSVAADISPSTPPLVNYGGTGGGTGTFEWTFPKPFIAAPIVQGGTQQDLPTGGGRLVVMGNTALGETTTTFTRGYRINIDTTPATRTNGPASVVAIGKWK